MVVSAIITCALSPDAVHMRFAFQIQPIRDSIASVQTAITELKVAASTIQLMFAMAFA